MAITQNTYTGDGSTVLYSFTFPYLETTDVKVTVNGTPTTAYTFANATTIQFNTAPVAGAAIRIYRDTDDASLAATFYSGSAIRAQDLNDNFTQNLYVTQEVNNNAVSIDGSNPMVGPLNMNGFQIDNLAAPTSNTDAATKQYVDNIAISGLPTTIPSANVVFTQAGTGAVQRTVESKLQDVVSVEDFGGTDNNKLQNALTSTAKTVVLGLGKTYNVTTALTSTISDRVIVGNGSTITTNGSIAANSAVLTVNGARSKVSGLRLVGTAGTTLCSGIQLNSGEACEVTGCDISNFTNGAGIVATASASGHKISGNRLTNCNPVSFGGLQYGSIHCNADKSSIRDNHIVDNDLTAISTFGGSYLMIIGNYIQGKAGSVTSGGIIFDGYTVGSVIDSNIINGCKVEGIQIAGSVTAYGGQSRDHTISNNFIHEAAYSGITLYGADADAVTNVVITGNNIKTLLTTGRGLELNRCTNVTFTSNLIYGYASGIEVPGPAPNALIGGNTFDSQLTTAINSFGRYWTVSGNRIVGRAGGTTTGISFNASAIAGDQLIEGNFIRNCLVGISGIFSSGQLVHVRSNKFQGNGTDLSYSGSSNPSSSSGNAFDTVLSGTFSLSGGIAAVSNVNIQANDKIVLYFLNWGVGGSQVTVGQHQIIEVTAGNRFVVESTKVADVSLLAYEIIR